MGSKLENNSSAVRKRIEGHRFNDEEGEEYEASKFGGFGDYFRRKKIKLQNLDAERRSQTLDKPRIFSGVVAHVNGYTQPSLNDLHHLIVDHGGGFMQYMDGKTTVTHVIASSLTPSKKVEFRRYRVVKPSWVVESVKAGKLLPWNNYRVVDEGPRQNVLGFQGGNVISQASTQRTGYREQTDTSWYTERVKDVATKLGASTPGYDLPPSGQRSQAIEDMSSITPHAPEPSGGAFAENPQRSPIREASESLVSRNSEEEATSTVSNGEMAKTGSPPTTPKSGVVTLENIRGSLDASTERVDSTERRAAEGPAQSISKKARMTAEEHNAALLADPKIWKSTVVNPDFLKQYYEESRLHHLSTWKAELKARLQSLARDRNDPQTARRKQLPGSRRYILHVDFDSFFAAVSLRSHPELQDKPVVIAHGNGSGAEIASSNYPARKFGIKNGMWMKRAQELCPELKVLPYDFQAYEAASRDFYAVILDTGGLVQSVSIDEALVDISQTCTEAGVSGDRSHHEGSLYREQAKANEVAEDVRAKVKDKTQCNVSVGIGGNILLAKVALRRAKPAGQYQILPEESLDFIGGLGVQDLPGVAYSMGGKLEEMGIKLVQDIREFSKEKLMSSLGPKTGEKLWEYARGIDRAEVGDQVVRKSVSAEVNWGVRFATQEQADEFVASLCGELQRRLINEGVKARQITLKVMRKATNVPMDPPKHLGHGPCDVFNKSTAWGAATNDKTYLAREAITILKGYGFPPGELRGLGVQATKLEPIKSAEKPLDSSQRRLYFKSEQKASLATSMDDIESPSKPTRFVKHPAAALATPASNSEPKSLLNTMGTQFLLPSQADPEVLAELPPDIQAKLAATEQSGHRDARQQELGFQARSASPSRARAVELPPQSQLDPEALSALPEDLREEVMGYYRTSPPKPNAQAKLPQSPRPQRAIMLPPKKLPTPTKGRTNALGRGRPRGGRKAVTRSGLLQSNFVASKKGDAETRADDIGALELDEDVLAALPEDIRQEVLEERRRERLKKVALDLTGKRKPRPAAPQGPYFVTLLPRPARPVFTAEKLSTLPELREALTAWVNEFQDEEPNAEDVSALSAYLKRVVLEEQDMSKAVSVVKWLDWLVGQHLNVEALWATAISTVKEQVQLAVHERGLGNVSF